MIKLMIGGFVLVVFLLFLQPQVQKRSLKQEYAHVS